MQFRVQFKLDYLISNNRIIRFFKKKNHVNWIRLFDFLVVQPKSNFLMKCYLMLDLEIYDFLKFIREFLMEISTM